MKKPKLKLTGKDGNAFFILARAWKAAKKAGWTSEEWSAVEKEAQSGDYENLLRTMVKYFEVS